MTHSGNTALGDCIEWYFKNMNVSFTPLIQTVLMNTVIYMPPLTS